MGIGVSLILIAVGAILVGQRHRGGIGVDLNTVGVILMVVGAIGAHLPGVLVELGGFGGTARDSRPR